MKRIFSFLCLMMVTGLILNAQSSKVTTAWTYLNYYDQEGKAKDLEKARDNIDIAIGHEKTMSSGKTWFYRGKTYYKMATNEELSKSSDVDLINIAYESFKKVIDLNDPKFKDTESMFPFIIDMSRLVFNNGILQYENQEYAKAYKSFMKTIDINNLLEANGKESLISSEDAIGNAALAARQGGMEDEEMAIYEKQMKSGVGDAAMYSTVVRKYKDMGNTAEAKKLLAEGLEKFPSDINLIIDELNFYIAEDRLPEAIDKLEKAIELDPGNATLYAAKGNALEKNGDVKAAKAAYMKALEFEPDNFNALNNLIATYLNEANEMKTEMDKLGVTPAEDKKFKELEGKRKELFKKILPYLDKGLEIQPDNQELQRVRVQLQSALGK